MSTTPTTLSALEAALDFQPQMTEPDFGAEPSLPQALRSYYTHSGLDARTADRLAQGYLTAWLKNAAALLRKEG